MMICRFSSHHHCWFYQGEASCEKVYSLLLCPLLSALVVSVSNLSVMFFDFILLFDLST